MYFKYLQSWTLKLHKNKVTHAEFSKREPWLLCTASTDKTCKLWDVRMVKDKKSALYTLEHTKPINSGRITLPFFTVLLSSRYIAKTRNTLLQN